MLFRLPRRDDVVASVACWWTLRLSTKHSLFESEAGRIKSVCRAVDWSEQTKPNAAACNSSANTKIIEWSRAFRAKRLVRIRPLSNCSQVAGRAPHKRNPVSCSLSCEEGCLAEVFFLPHYPFNEQHLDNNKRRVDIVLKFRAIPPSHTLSACHRIASIQLQPSIHPSFRCSSTTVIRAQPSISTVAANPFLKCRPRLHARGLWPLSLTSGGPSQPININIKPRRLASVSAVPVIRCDRPRFHTSQQVPFVCCVCVCVHSAWHKPRLENSTGEFLYVCVCVCVVLFSTSSMSIFMCVHEHKNPVRNYWAYVRMDRERVRIELICVRSVNG